MISDESTSATPQGRRALHRLRQSRLIFESALIILSVLLGLALSDWQSQRNDRALGRQALANFRREIETNLAALKRAQPRHAQLATQLDSASRLGRPGEMAFTAFASLIRDQGVATEPLREAAWETAVSTGALRLIEYEQAAQLSELYLVQRSSIGQTIRLLSDRFMTPQNFDPATRESMLRTHGMLLTELSGQESYLIAIYQRVLTKLPKDTR
jgi:type II secretory pathway pseudopilin PulG